MKILFLILLSLFFQHAVPAQQLQQRDANPVDLDSINMDMYYFAELLVDKIPKFKGKNEDFNKYISTYLVYPTEAYNHSVEGMVYVSYVIDTNGKIKDVTIIQSSNVLLNAAVIDVVSNSPKWKPAEYKGKPVPYKKMSGVRFSL